MSDAETSWFLRHRDGVEHGPFRLEDLVDAARAGNIAVDTAVRHEVHTRGQWILATRVHPIVAAMTPESGATAAPTPSQTPTPSEAPAPSEAPTHSAPRQRPAAASPPSSATPSTPAQSQPRSAGTPAQRTAAAQRPKATAPASTPTETAAGRSSEIESPDEMIESTPRIRAGRDHAYPVPRTFVDACVGLFDFRFRTFITPWIIKILWVLSVAGGLLWIAKFGYDLLLQPMMSSPEAGVRNDPGDWQFEPLGNQSFFDTGFFHFLIRSSVISILLLCTRVAMEGTIVIFHIASDLHAMRTMQEKK